MNALVPVLHVINDCVDGSIVRIVERIIRYSPENEFEWHVGHVKPGEGFSDQLSQVGATVIDFSKKPGFTASSAAQIRNYVIENGIQVVHSHTPRTILGVWLALKFIGPSLESNVVHLATKHLMTGVHDRKMGLFFAVFDRLSLYLADHFLPVSHTMGKVLTSQLGVPRSKVTPIPNAIPVEDYYRPEERTSFREELGLSPQMLAIGFTGRITKVKCLDLLLEAFNAVFPLYPHARLVIAGEGDLRPQLEMLAERLKINNAVIWLGFYDDIPRLLSGLDIYVQPSVNEGLSLSVLEAMASENPVIVTRVGSAEEIIEDGRTGILIEPGSDSDIASALLTLLSNNHMRDRLAAKGKEFVFKEYNIQKMVTAYCRIYRKMRKAG